jgi:ankyrin repeat protein
VSSQNGNSPLCAAIQSGFEDVTRVLLAAGASVGAINHVRVVTFGNVVFVLQYVCRVYVFVQERESALIVAIKNARVRSATQLIEKKADVNAMDKVCHL